MRSIVRRLPTNVERATVDDRAARRPIEFAMQDSFAKQREIAISRTISRSLPGRYPHTLLHVVRAPLQDTLIPLWHSTH